MAVCHLIRCAQRAGLQADNEAGSEPAMTGMG